jgi:anti-anti-sigma factor
VDELEAQEQAEPALEVEVTAQDDGIVVVRLAGEVDMSNVEDLEERVAPQLASSPQHLVVDASRLTFADSSAIALWVRWSANVGRLELRDASPLIRRVLRAMGLDTTLELTP